MAEELAPAADDPGIESVPVSETTPISPRDAANVLLDFRRKRDAQESEPEQPAAPKAAAAEPESPEKEEPAVPAEAAGEEAPTETTEPEAELPPIEPPRSWTKEEKESFKSYPRELQETLARREQDRETSLRRGQNETAEQRKTLEVERQKLAQAQQKVDEALPQLLQTLHELQMGEFSDIKTMEDVKKLANEDWPRYAKWDAQQKQVAAVAQEVKAANERQATEFRTKWNEFAAKEDAKFLELAPELADKAVSTKTADACVALLKEIGFSDEELAKLWNGEASLSLRDHRSQLIIRDAARFHQAKIDAPKKVAAKPVPTVQRPGTPRPKGADEDARISNLEKQLERTGSWKDAAELMVARRARQ